MHLGETSVSICKDKMSLHVAVWPYHKCISASVGKTLLSVNKQLKNSGIHRTSAHNCLTGNLFQFISFHVSEFRFINFKWFFCLKSGRVCSKQISLQYSSKFWNCAWHFFYNSDNPSLNFYEELCYFLLVK